MFGFMPSISVICGLSRVSRMAVCLPVRRPIASAIRHSYNSPKALQQERITIEEPGDKGKQTLYYHLLSTSSNGAIMQKWAVSFLSTPPSNGSIEDKSILGSLPAYQVDRFSVNTYGENIFLEKFEENPRFVATLHKAIQSVLLSDEDDTLKAEALVRGEGWMHICGTSKLGVVNMISQTTPTQINEHYLH
jgi:hypothetical protein